jgi:hypothetical protein
LGVFVLFVHFLAGRRKKRFHIKELKIPQVAKACEPAKRCYKPLLTPLPPENARKGRIPQVGRKRVARLMRVAAICFPSYSDRSKFSRHE